MTLFLGQGSIDRLFSTDWTGKQLGCQVAFDKSND